MRYHLSLPLLLLVAGCSSAGTDPGKNTVDINAAAARAQGSVDAYAANAAKDVAVAVPTPTPSALAPLDPPAPGTPGGLPDDRTPVSEASFTPDSPQGAANVVQTYYALLGEGNYARARSLWEDGGKASGADPAAFAAQLGRYAEYHANVGAPGAEDAGAGQRYVTVPVQIYARLKEGGKPDYEIGSVTLHRVGDIDGATAEQKSWHIHSIELRPAPARR